MLGRQAFWAIATLTAAYKGRPPPLRLAAQPPLLRLPRVLSTEQCAELIQASKAEPEFQNSFKAIDRSNSHGLEWQQQALQQRETTFAQFDADKDGLLQESEVADFLNVGWSMPNHNHTHLLRKLKRKVDALSLADFKSFDWSGYMRRLRKQRPHLFARFSHQVWMPRHHPAARAVQARIAEALGLDLDVFPLSEPLLVVMYPQHGHYACHSDNPEDDTAFPHRYLTAEIFLNDAYEGGEVVFPFADSEEPRTRWRDLKKSCLPTEECLAGKVLHAATGDVLAWENVEHLPAGGLRALLPQSLHAGCAVRGEKWIALQWISSAAINQSGKLPRTSL